MKQSPADTIRRQSNSRVFGGLLFWCMVLFGAVLVVPTLVLPPWIRFEEKKREKETQIELLASLQTELEIVRKQNEYRDDPEFLAQLERSELGAEPVGAERITIDPRILEETQQELAARRNAEAPAGPEEDTLVTALRRMFTKYPITQVYLQPYFRDILLAVGGGSILLAVVLLSQSAKPIELKPSKDEERAA